MGSYVFALQPPATVRIVELDGRPIALGHIAYAYKPVVLSGRQGAKINRALDYEHVRPLRMAWLDRPEPRPSFVTVGDDTEAVHSWPRLWMTCHDTAIGNSVQYIGRLKGGVITRP